MNKLKFISFYVHYSCYSGNFNPLFLIYHINYDEACLFISALVKPTRAELSNAALKQSQEESQLLSHAP